MLITLLALIALFFIARSLMMRYGGNVALSNAVAATIVIAFLAGFAGHAILFPGPQTAAAPVGVAPAPVATSASPPPGTAVAPMNRVLSQAQVARLLPTGKAMSYSVIEGPDGTGPSGDQFPAGATIVVHGWAGDPTTKSTAAGLLLIVDGRRRLDATKGYGGDRIDVARAFTTMTMLHTGFAMMLPTAGLAKGTHHLELAAIRRDGRHYQIITFPPKAFTLN